MPEDLSMAGPYLREGNAPKQSRTPTASIPPRSETNDVFERLAQCRTLLTAKELAELLAISPKTVYSYVSRNMIPYYKIEANVRLRARDIAEWLQRRAA